MSDDNDEDWNEIICQENNPYDDPDMTFECEDDAFEAGVQLSLENVTGDAIDLDSEIEYYSEEPEIIKAFKAGYNSGSRIKIDKEYGSTETEEINLNTIVYCPDAYDDDGEIINDEEEDDDDENQEED